MEELLRELIEYIGDDYSPEQESFLLTLLSDATDEIVSEMYPYGFFSDKEEISIKERAIKRYKSKIRKIAQYHYDKQGREGATGWSENGTSVSYDASGTPSSNLRGIIPIARIV